MALEKLVVDKARFMRKEEEKKAKEEELEKMSTELMIDRIGLDFEAAAADNYGQMCQLGRIDR